MYSRILVAVDDSDLSKKTLQEAIDLAKDQQARLCIVYIANEFIQAGEGVAVNFKQHEESGRNRGKLLLNKMVKLANRSHDKVDCRLIEITGSEPTISKEILDQAKNWRADLIVLGTHGRSGLSRLLFGSVAEEVIRHTSIPVHLIHYEE